MSMDISRRKEKEKEKEKDRKARKTRMIKAKEENQEMEKVSPTTFNLRPHRPLPFRTNNSKAPLWASSRHSEAEQVG